MLIHEDDDSDSELNLELCLGNSLMKPKSVSRFTRNGERSKDLIYGRVANVHDRTEGVEDEREIGMIEDNIACPQIHLHEKFCSVGYRRDANDPCAANMSTKKVVAVELVRSFSDETDILSSATVDANRWKEEEHVAVQQRARELHDQKRQAERKKRKVSIPEEKQQKQLEKSKPSSGPPRTSYTGKFVKNNIRNRQEKKADEQSLLKGSSNSSILTCQTMKTDKEEASLQEERTQFQETHRNTQREQHRAAADNVECILGSRPKEDMLTETCSGNKSSKVTEEQTKFERAHWIQRNHELYIQSSTINCGNEDKVDNFNKKKGVGVNGSTEETAKDPNPLKNLLSSSNRNQDPNTASVASLPFTLPSLPAASSSFIQNPFGVPMYVSNVGAVSYPLPYFVPHIAAQPSGGHGECSFISYPFSVPSSSGTSLHPATVTALTSQTPVFHPLPIRRSPIAQKRKSPTSSCQEEKYCEVGATFSSQETRKLPVLSKILPEDASSESKGRSWMDQADSHALSTTSSGLQEEAAASGPAHSGKSSSSGVYPSAHGESAESFPSTTKSGNINHQSIEENSQGTATKAEHGADCNQGAAAAHIRLPLTVGPLVTTTVNGNTTTGFLYTYSKGDVKICCECHGESMTAREFVVHAGGADGPHPERSIVVKFPVVGV